MIQTVALFGNSGSQNFLYGICLIVDYLYVCLLIQFLRVFAEMNFWFSLGAGTTKLTVIFST